MDNLPVFYNFEALKSSFSDGNHYMAIGFSTPFCLHVPNDNYVVAVEHQGRTRTAQIILEKRKRHQASNANQEALTFADKHGAHWNTSVLIYLPLRHPDPTIHNSYDEMTKIAKQHHEYYKKEAISVFNYLVNAYRLHTGECHITPLLGRDSLADYSVALIFNDKSATKLIAYHFPVRLLDNLLPIEPKFPPTIIADIQKRLISGTKINLTDELLLNAYNLLDQGNYRLAIIEAETAFEVAVRHYLRIHFQNLQIEEAIRQIDKINQFKELLKHPHFKKTIGARLKVFEFGQSYYDAWEAHVWRVRSDLIHGIIEYASEEDAIKALIIIETTLEYLFDRPKTAQNVINTA